MRIKFVFGAVAILVALTASSLAMMYQPAVAASSSCKPQYPVAPAHRPSATSLAGLASTPNLNMPTVVKRAPAPGHKKWDGDDRTRDLAQIGNIMYVGGEFDAVKWQGNTYTRHNIFAFNVNTGKPTSFAPNVDGEVMSVAPSCTGTLLYIGGNFHHVNGKTRNYIAKIWADDGHLANWNPNPNNQVSSIRLMHGGHVIVSGLFTKIGNTARDGIAAIAPLKGTAGNYLNISVTGSDPSGPKRVFRVTPNHAQTYAVMIGNFNDVAGKAHRRIAILKLGDSRATVTKWHTSKTDSRNNSNSSTDCSKPYNYPERGIAWAPNDSFFLTAATGGAHSGSLCDATAKWDASSAAALSNPKALPLHIQYTGGDTMTGVATTNTAAIITGHFRWGDNPPIYPMVEMPPGTPCNKNRVEGHRGYGCQNPPSIGGTSVNRPGIMEVATNTMRTTSWNPTRSRQIAMHNFMALTPKGLWILSDGDKFAGKQVNDLVLVPFATPLE